MTDDPLQKFADDITKAYTADAEECQRLARELATDLRRLSCPHETILKVDRLCELVGVNLGKGTDA